MSYGYVTRLAARIVGAPLRRKPSRYRHLSADPSCGHGSGEPNCCDRAHPASVRHVAPELVASAHASRAKAVTARYGVPMRYLSDACRLAVRSSPDLHVDVTATDLEVEPCEPGSPYNGGVDCGWWNDDREELRSVA